MGTIRPPYRFSKPDYQVGDIIFYGGTHWISRLIRWVTRGPMSHCAIVAATDPDDLPDCEFAPPVLAEALAQGFVYENLDHDIKTSAGTMWAFRRQHPLTPDEQHCIQCWVRENHNDKYDYEGAIAAGVHLDDHRDSKKVFCSEAVVRAYQSAGLLLPLNAANTTPNDLWRYLRRNKRGFWHYWRIK